MVKAFFLIVATLAASIMARPIKLSDLIDAAGTNVTTTDATTIDANGVQGAAGTNNTTADTGDADDNDDEDEDEDDGLNNFGGISIPAGSSDAADEQQAEFASASAAAAAAEKKAGIDVAASIAAASSSAAAVAATATVNPLDPFPVPSTNLTPEQLGQLSGLRAKLAIDNQFNDTGAAIDDQESIDALIESGEGGFGF
ncbi:hypothetical protein DFH08DRAFT_895929 [Mycena albidolilacea]|uniref:Uncharacterized protein n=1 Tax=Mycena albidolilacea TaxID=1033008 RepID=A0AAD6Z9W8_9AGAR|nr:hypothetical protein DFH08DRAFT_895929 [Mycena albidolilacea]